MTKDRRIAIDMWRWIRANWDMYLRFKDNEVECPYEEDALLLMKDIYLADKGVNWVSDCWFCTYLRPRPEPSCRRGCFLCPLQSCSSGPYHTLVNNPTYEEYVDACDQIIEALGGEE